MSSGILKGLDGILEGPCGDLRVILEEVKRFLGPWADLWGPGGVLERPWGDLGGIWSWWILGGSWKDLGGFWGIFGGSWGI